MNQKNNDDLLKQFQSIVNCSNNEQAIQILENTNYQLDKAIDLYYQNQSGEKINTEKKEYNEDVSFIHNQQAHEQLAIDYQKIILSGFTLEEFLLTYKQQQNYQKSWAQRFKKIFLKQKDCGTQLLIQLFKKKQLIPFNFQIGSLEQNLAEAKKLNQPLFIYIHSVDTVDINHLLKSKTLKEKIDSTFRVTGMVGNMQQLSVWNQELQLQIPSILIAKNNIFNKIQILGLINLKNQTKTEEVITFLNFTIKIYQNLTQLEEQIKSLIENNDMIGLYNLFGINSVNNSAEIDQFDNQNFVDQQLLKQQQIENDRRLREEQLIALQQAEEIAIMEAERKLEIERENQRKENLKLIKEEEIKLKKGLILSQLSEEPKENDPSTIIFMFRMPNGNQIQRRFNQNDRIQSLFDFIFCEDHKSFENEYSDFDLIQNFPKLELKQFKENTIEEIFKDSIMEQLIVKEDD